MVDAASLFTQNAKPEGVAYLVIDLNNQAVFFRKIKRNSQSCNIYIPIDNRLSSLALFKLQNYLYFFLFDLKKNRKIIKNSYLVFSKKGQAILRSIRQTCAKFSLAQENLDQIVTADEAIRTLPVSRCWPTSAESAADALKHIESLMGANRKKIVGNLEHALFEKLTGAAKNGAVLTESQGNFLATRNRQERINPFHQVPRSSPKKESL